MSSVDHITEASKAFQDTLRSVPVDQCAAEDLQRLIGTVRSTQRFLDGLITRVGVASDRLANKGRSAPADEMLLDGGSVSGSTARRDATRAKTSSEVTGLSEAFLDGAISDAQWSAIRAIYSRCA